jgi:hypothetical protein
VGSKATECHVFAWRVAGGGVRLEVEFWRVGVSGVLDGCGDAMVEIWWSFARFRKFGYKG